MKEPCSGGKFTGQKSSFIMLASFFPKYQPFPHDTCQTMIARLVLCTVFKARDTVVLDVTRISSLVF
ncbi:MAG: hypothetical protein ACFFD4_26580 [Candidatus Odinarchaeota archaeon]